jgi:hypothetical protein
VRRSNAPLLGAGRIAGAKRARQFRCLRRLTYITLAEASSGAIFIISTNVS